MRGLLSLFDGAEGFASGLPLDSPDIHSLCTTPSSGVSEMHISVQQFGVIRDSSKLHVSTANTTAGSQESHQNYPFVGLEELTQFITEDTFTGLISPHLSNGQLASATLDTYEELLELITNEPGACFCVKPSDSSVFQQIFSA